MTKFDRSIFLYDDFEDIDETWKHGSYIGGLGSADGDAGIARQYRRAADVIVAHALQHDEAWETVLPALFLYRHAIEVRLKAIVRPRKINHNLVELAQEINSRLAEHGASLPDELIARVAELESVDRKADAFRFTNDVKQMPHFANEVWVHLSYLREVISWIDEELEAAERLMARSPQ